MVTLAELNSADEELAGSIVTPLIERAPEIAIQVARRRPFENLDQLNDAIRRELLRLCDEERLELFRKHPELAPENPMTMTGESQSEQGRLNLTSDENEYRALLSELNAKYRLKFDFPFITALVRHPGMESVLAEFKKRIANDRKSEIKQSIEQIIIVSSSRAHALFADEKANPVQRASTAQ